MPRWTEYFPYMRVQLARKGEIPASQTAYGMYSDAFFVSITILEDIGLLVHALETWGILSIASLRGIFPALPFIVSPVSSVIVRLCNHVSKRYGMLDRVSLFRKPCIGVSLEACMFPCLSLFVEDAYFCSE